MGRTPNMTQEEIENAKKYSYYSTKIGELYGKEKAKPRHKIPLFFKSIIPRIILAIDKMLGITDD